MAVLGQGKVEYHMRAYDSGDSSYKRWVSVGQPDRVGFYAPTPVGTYSDFQVERTVDLETRYEPYLHRWNEKDVSQFEQVLGNGIGGVGSPGDWTFEYSTGPAGGDAPMLKITNVTGVSGSPPAADAIWLFNDFEGGLPERFFAGWRSTRITGVGGMGVGIIPYYEDTTHYFVVWRGNSTQFAIYGRGLTAGDFYANRVFGRVANDTAALDVTNGDALGFTAWWRKATPHQLPGILVKGGGPFDVSFQGTGAVLQDVSCQPLRVSEANASWNTLSGYRPRIGIFARGGTVGTSEYIGGLTFHRAYGGV